jgi:hypothetical protein
MHGDRSLPGPKGGIEVLWMVQVHAAAVDSEDKPALRLPNRCLGIVRAERFRGSISADGWAISISVEAANPREAWISAMNCVFSAVLEGAIPPWPIVGVAVLDGEYAVASGRWFEFS